MNKSGLELQFNFNEPGTVASDTSGKSSRDLTISEGSIVGGDPAAPGSLSQTLYPRYVRATVNVGDRIAPPAGEVSLAGYIQQSSGDSFHAVAYKDPFASGFETANAGAIIPINAIPGKDVLEVWWFRQNKTTALKNVVNGFKPIYWPAVLGRYTHTMAKASADRQQRRQRRARKPASQGHHLHAERFHSPGLQSQRGARGQDRWSGLRVAR